MRSNLKRPRGYPKGAKELIKQINEILNKPGVREGIAAAKLQFKKMGFKPKSLKAQ